MLQVLLVLACFSLSGTLGNVLVDYNGNFSALANEVEFELQQKRAFNGELIREFNREMLLEFGTMIPRMRQVSHDTEQYIINRDNVDEECREYALFLFELYRMFQEFDIQDCAYYAFADLRADSLNRFMPYEQSYSHFNTRSVSQTIITLARNNILDNEAVVAELADELDFYINLRESYRVLLDEELAKHGDDAYITINRFEDCRDEAYYWQDNDMEYIKSYLDDDCYLG
ncbi:hypothetical protein AND_010700 [Anopheles darlingi]|uniref:Secreted protein n=1 Tax=Anopheles darlingi TaxID=43151 RepID=W5J4F8_ANODA|nr:hypothetical protein AND_010700 [Anopheles darlingi]